MSLWRNRFASESLTEGELGGGAAQPGSRVDGLPGPAKSLARILQKSTTHRLDAGHDYCLIPAWPEHWAEMKGDRQSLKKGCPQAGVGPGVRCGGVSTVLPHAAWAEGRQPGWSVHS